MIPPEFEKQIHAAMQRVGDRLVETGHASRYLSNSATGKGEIRLTDSGLLLAASLKKLFGSQIDHPTELLTFELLALTQMIRE